MGATRGGTTTSAVADSEEFCLTDGGRLYRASVLRPLREPAGGRPRTRVLLLFALTWLPLAIAAVVDRTFLTSAATPQSFLRDIAVHARFLVALPLFLFVEPIIDRRTRAILVYLRESNLVPEEEKPAFQATLARLRRWRDSGWMEAVLILASIGLGISASYAGPVERQVAEQGGSWKWTEAGAHTLGGAWYFFVAGPILVFHLLRLLYRFGLWAIFLKKLAGLKLRLQPSHPDGSGGLGILSLGQRSFSSIFIALSIMVSASLASEILFRGHNVMEYRAAVISYTVLAVLVLFGPLLFFSRRARLVREDGLVRYGAAGVTIWEKFEARWLSGVRSDEREGDIDPSTLADFSTTHANIVRMSVLPIDRQSVVSTAVGIIAPFLPLLLTAMSLKDIFERLLKAVM